MRLSFRFLGRVGVCALLVLTAAAPTAGAAPAQQGVPASDAAGNEWLTYGGNFFNQRYSSLNQISTSNVAQLKGAWTYHTGSSTDATSFESSPVVSGGIMYVTGPQSQVYALDAKTGSELWKYVPDYGSTQVAGVRGAPALPLCCGQVNRGVAIGDGRVYVAQLDAKLTALDAKTGDVAWTVQDDDPRAGYSQTMAPLFYNGMVVVGISGAEYEIRGHVTAYDAASGTQMWRFYTIPAPGDVGSDTWPQGSNIWQYGGGSMWQTPAVDPDLGMLYIAVGNPSPDLDGTVRAGNNLFTESLVALDLKTGQYKWHFQEVHHDIWDYDSISPNVLFDVQINGKTVKGLGQAGKTGWLYLLDRTNGQPIVGIDERAVPQLGSQNTAPTQPYPSGDSFVPQACTESIGNYPTSGIFTPFRDDPILICPGANGGTEWSPSSYSPQTNLMYVCGIHQPQVWTAKPDKIEQGTLRLGSAFVTPPGGKTSGTFTAMDVRTNRKVWQANLDQMCMGGSLATAGGLVFAGEGNGNVDAFDAKSGDRLWQFQTGAGANAPPITYSVDGQQYVAIASGGNFQLNFPRGDTLWVFSLNGGMGPVEAPQFANPETAIGASVTSANVVDFGYAPGNDLVPPGTTITWTNTGQIGHTVTSDDGAFDSGNMPPGATYTFTFDEPGTYWYFCRPHPFMRGRIVVATDAPEPSGAPAIPEQPTPAQED
ncbi:MAG: PQQ-dependent dehydrogenase, methanol/ethanol family [Chloroflexi bacterium]|nr:PQQ-dependent dehydrogenase, methanol/ethanol family [Chloroflexota bacterium]